MSNNPLNIINKRASYEYFLHQKFVAGIQLLGSEIKSIRAGNVTLSDAYCLFNGEELFVRSMHIGTFKQASYNNHEPLRDRKLLLKKTELRKLQNKASEKGTAIIPVRIFLSETGFAKMEIAIAQGKKSFDKRESIKEKDIERQLRRGE